MLMLNENSVSFYTLGCRLNQSETAVVERAFENNGFKIVDFDKPAKVVIINTCTVTENGDTDARRLVNKVNRLNPEARIALIGCQAQIQKDKLTHLPNVRWVVGNARKMEIADIVRDSNPRTPAQVIAPTIPRASFTIPVAGIDPKRTRANLKIQDGCDFFCSFCEIPYARGRSRSREFKNILWEADQLTKAGRKELVLTGINIGTYKYRHYVLLDVIEALEQIPALKRIRISSIEPTTIPLTLLKKMSQKTKLCRHLHIPLQSGNDIMLKQMKRLYSSAEFNNFIKKAHDMIPQLCLGTDIIVGFPGETKEQFQDTQKLLKQLPIHYFHIFRYSQRNRAKSQNTPNIIPSKTIQERSKILRDLSRHKRHAFYESFIGSRQKVLFEQQKKGYWQGLTDHYIRVQVRSQKDLSNQIIEVKFNEIVESNICGNII